MTAKCLGPLLWNKPKSSALHLRAWQLVWVLVFVVICCVWFSLALCILAKHLYLDVALGFFWNFSEHCSVWLWGEFSWTSTPLTIGNCLKYFQLVNLSNPSNHRVKTSILFGNGLITLHRFIGSNNCFSKVISHVFPLWHCVNTHLNVPDQQTTKTSDCIYIISITWLWIALLIPMEAIQLYLAFLSNASAFWLSFCYINNDTVWYVMS